MPRRIARVAAGGWSRLVIWGNRNPFFTGLILAGLLVAGGYWRLEMIAQRADDRVECVTDVLYDSIKATNERTTYSEELSQANEDQLRSFQALIAASLRANPPDEEEAREIVEDYSDALAAYFKVSAKAAQKRENFPYPTAQEVAECR